MSRTGAGSGAGAPEPRTGTRNKLRGDQDQVPAQCGDAAEISTRETQDQHLWPVPVQAGRCQLDAVIIIILNVSVILIKFLVNQYPINNQNQQ